MRTDSRWRSAETNAQPMIKNYIKVALRQLWRHKFFSILNIFGLATSMAVCLLLIMIVMDQYGYDEFHENKTRIFRVISANAGENEPLKGPQFATAALSLQQPLSEEFPFIEKVTRMVQIGLNGWKFNNQEYDTGGGFMVDEDFLDIFSFGWLNGNQETALEQPHSLVISDKAQAEMFPNQDPIGKVIDWKGLGEFTITGVIKQPPVRSHIKFNFLIPFSTWEALNDQQKESIAVTNLDDTWRGLVYVLLKNAGQQQQFDESLAGLADKYTQRIPGQQYLFESQALGDIMPSRDLSNEIGIGTPTIVLYFLMSLGLIIILSACFNYTTLSIARSLKRAKEIGIRKVAGAYKRDIIFQFLGEAILIALLALVVAVVLLEYLIPAFYGLDPFVAQTFYLSKTPMTYFIFFIFSIIVGFLAGFFPAFNISAFQPIAAIQQLSNVKVFSRTGIRKALIGIQFALSLIFILMVIIVLKQQAYVLNTDLGSNTEHLLNVRMDTVDYQLFAEQVRQIKGVEGVSASERVILTGENYTATAVFNNQSDSMTLQCNTITPSYIQNLAIKLIAGKMFENAITEASHDAVLLNEQAVSRMGFQSPNEAIGAELLFEDRIIRVIGVVKNFHHDNIWFNPIEPYAFFFGKAAYRNANIQLTPGLTKEALASIRSTWSTIAPGQDFIAFFTDERVFYLNKFFNVGSRIIGFVGFLTILIACLGLLGMVIYTVEGKTKEVGIRKVLGASVGHIIWQLSKRFVWLIFMSILIAVPITILGANLWLQNFYLRISIGPLMILGGISILLTLAGITIISQTFFAANQNPVHAIRRA